MHIPYWTERGTIDLANLRPEDMTAEIFAGSLANLNRFNGRTRMPWSVAAHSVLVERLCPPELGPWALLHDAHEVFLADITTPAVDLIASWGNIPGFDDALAVVKARLDGIIAHAWSVLNRSSNAYIRRADRIALCAERVAWMGGPPDILEPGDAEDIDRAVRLIFTMDCPDWMAARDLWLSRILHHAARGGLTPPVAPNPACMVQAG